MKGKTALYLAAALMVLGACGKPGLKEPWDKGGFETGEYRNVFVEVGHSPAEVEQKLEEVFQEVFFGPDRCYFEVGDSLGYMSDVKNYDVRTEGQSYGMMIAVQMDRKDILLPH